MQRRCFEEALEDIQAKLRVKRFARRFTIAMQRLVCLGKSVPKMKDGRGIRVMEVPFVVLLFNVMQE